MGTINYGTSDYVTVGYRPVYAFDLEDDPDFLDYAQHELGIDADDADEIGAAAESEACFMQELAHDDIRAILDGYSFRYYHIAIKPGYYDGFYLDIENNFGAAYDCWEDRRDAQKEITRIKAFLLECIDNGLCVVWPGWCAEYLSREESIKEINKAIKAMREEVKATPTWRQYNAA